MLSRHTRALTSTRGIRGTRSLHDGGKWGYQAKQEFTVDDFTSSELSNRSKNSSLLRLVESYRVSHPFYYHLISSADSLYHF